MIKQGVSQTRENLQNLENLQKDLIGLANKEKAKLLAGFFKTGPGQYGEGDVFIGVVVPDERMIAKKYCDLSFADTIKLLHSKEHEFRVTALFILMQKYSRGTLLERKKIVDLYLSNTKWINNWDLIDLSANKILGHAIFNKFFSDINSETLTKLVKSNSLWERRMAIIATGAFIVEGQHKETFRIAKILLKDKHDLIHKAVGWMLREVGKRCGRDIEIKFLERHHKTMPRTMLRYSLEHFSEVEKKRYM